MKSEIFCIRLREIRKKQGHTLQSLGSQIGMKKSSLGNIERGDKAPSLDTVIALADTLNISIDYLLGRIDDPILRK